MERIRNLSWELVAAGVFALLVWLASNALGVSGPWSFIPGLLVGILLLLLLEYAQDAKTIILLTLLVTSGFLNLYSFVRPRISSTVPIEDLPLRAFAYDGEDDPNSVVIGGNAWVYYLVSEDGDKNYQVDYYLPEVVADDQWVYAGFTFQFLRAQDLTEFEALEMVLSFDEDDDRTKVLVRDSDGAEKTVTLGSGSFQCGPEPIRVETDQDGLRYRIPLSTCFGDVDLTSTSEVNFVVDGNLPLGRGSFTIHELSLIRK